MNKEQFWEIIDVVNASAGQADHETRCCRIQEALLHTSLEDIMDWHLILELYRQAAYREDLRAASAALGAPVTEDGFSKFRSWLISRGKEAYMNALSAPGTLMGVPYEGNTFNFERFTYIGYFAYDAKLFFLNPGSQKDLFQALRTYALDEQTRRDIQAELLGAAVSDDDGAPCPVIG